MSAIPGMLSLNIITDPVCYKFELFMQDPTIIRYGSFEKVSSKRLTEIFNTTCGENISFNRRFPRLMSEYIAKYPQYNIFKKLMESGVYYCGVGLATDPIYTGKPLPLTAKQKNDRRRDKILNMSREIERQVCDISGWTPIEFKYLADLKLLEIIKFQNNYIIEAIIDVTKSNLIHYVMTFLNELDRLKLIANHSKTNYESGMVDESFMSIGHDLLLSVQKYDTIRFLPRLNFIIYPDKDYLTDLALWLKRESKRYIRTNLIRDNNPPIIDNPDNEGPILQLDQTIHPKCNKVDCKEFARCVDQYDQRIYPIRCIAHKLDTDIELTYRKCQQCNQESYFPLNYLLCTECGEYGKVHVRRINEYKVKHLFESNEINFIYNKPISKDKSACKPDFLIQSPFGFIICEVDEKQHINIHPSDEISRMKSIYNDIAFLNLSSQVLFIRFNPDKYKGLQFDLDSRYKYLCQTIHHCRLLQSINVPIGVLYLFYDGFNGSPQIQEIPILNTSAILMDIIEDNVRIT
jgi:hypothetical protein